jgi:hypothetical protein
MRRCGSTANAEVMSETAHVDARPPAAPPSAPQLAAYVLSALAALLMAVASVVGVAVRGFYPDIPWAAEAFRGGDLVNLLVGTPLLVTAMVVAARGSHRAILVWAGALGYTMYTYAYVVFGADFNALFLVHVVILSSAIWALICLFATTDIRMLATSFDSRTPARAVAVLLGGTAVTLAGLWSYSSLRQAVTGRLPGGAAPPAALHMVYATDLTFFVVPLGVATVLLWRRTAWGYVLGTVMAVMGASYLVNLMSAAAFQSRAGVTGVAAFSPFSLALDLAFAAAAAVMLARMTPHPVPDTQHQRGDARPQQGRPPSGPRVSTGTNPVVDIATPRAAQVRPPNAPRGTRQGATTGHFEDGSDHGGR